MYSDTRTIANHGATPLLVWLEPWVEEVEISPGMAATFIGDSNFEGKLEVLEEPSVCVFGWSGASMRVEINGKVVWASYAPAPQLRPGMTVRDFLGVLGLRKDDRNA